MTVGVVVFPRSNCEVDLRHARRARGGDGRVVEHGDHSLGDLDAVVLPGGFAHRDYQRPGALAPFYPIVEAGTGLRCALVVIVKGPEAEAIIGIVLVLILVPVTLIDLDPHTIPNKITYPGFVVGVALVAALDTDSLLENLIASAAAG